MAVITITTDFGDTSPYVAVMKGVILNIAPTAILADLTHRIRPQDVAHADYFLGTCVPYYPPGTVHLAVVDPGVGSDRKAILIEAGGQFLIGPDNGLFTRAVQSLGITATVRTLDNPQFHRPNVSPTFHGRDVFAPSAAHLARGVAPSEFGPVQTNWVRRKQTSAVCWKNQCVGEVQFIDDFGNIITNIPIRRVKELPIQVSRNDEQPHPILWVRTFTDAKPGVLVCLFSSDGFFEIAEVNGHAANRMAAAIGMRVELRFGGSSEIK